ncbi:MAG TPA: helix-turn-helix domain-containing protein [Chitinophagaceae bacterium]|nr:helix-turn-helix domain-containing protein [Chitinophagaceae bacterium]
MMQIIAWIGVSQAIFAAILMLSKKENNVSDKVLFFWLVLLTFDFFTCGLDYELFQKPLLSSSFLLFNPALYLYIRSLTNKNFKLNFFQFLHFIPYLAFKVLSYILKEPFSMNTFFNVDENLIYRMMFGTATTISCVVYSILSLRIVHIHRMKLQNEHSNIDENDNITWVLFVSIFYVVYCIVAFIIALLAYFTSSYPLSPHFYNYSVLLFLIYILSFYGLYQHRLSPIALAQDHNKIPYQNSSLSNDLKQQIKVKIEQLIVHEKLYLDSNLNMDMLSNKLKIPKYQITEVLNTVIGQNFFQYVNYHRVEAVKEMLSNKKNLYSIEAIGYECGFSSKSSFYTVFKNLTGKTPVAYRNTIKTD